MSNRKTNQFQEYSGNPVELERKLIAHISNTGREQIKKRRKAGLSAFFVKQNRLTELKPDRTEIQGKKIESRWVTLEKGKRSIVLK